MSEPIPNENNATVIAVVKEAAVIAMLEDYARYLMKHQKVTSTAECKEKLGQIITLAMDRGEASQDTLAHLDRWLAKQTVHTELTCLSHHVEKFLAHALTEELCEILDDAKVEDETAYAEFRQVNELRKQYEAAATSLIGKYGEQLKSMAYQFLTNYKSAFDPEFVAKIDQAAQIQQVEPQEA